jgi:hypothetical protein
MAPTTVKVMPFRLVKGLISNSSLTTVCPLN